MVTHQILALRIEVRALAGKQKDPPGKIRRVFVLRPCYSVRLNNNVDYRLTYSKCYNKSYYLCTMRQTYRARITKIGNSKGVRLPKELALSLGTAEVLLEQTADGILIKPAPAIPPLSQWAAIFATADTGPEPEMTDWDVTLQDGLDDE